MPTAATSNENRADRSDIPAAIANTPKPRKPSKLPRLGEVPFVTKTREVELPDAGASVLLKKPSVALILEMQDVADSDNADMRQLYGSTIRLVAGMLVEPELTEEQLRELTDQMTFGDWQHLQDQAMDLAGLGEEARRQTAGEFRESQRG